MMDETTRNVGTGLRNIATDGMHAIDWVERWGEPCQGHPGKVVVQTCGNPRKCRRCGRSVYPGPPDEVPRHIPIGWYNIKILERQEFAMMTGLAVDGG